MSKVFSGFMLKNKEVKNRLVVPPMVCFDLADTSGFVGEKSVAHYDQLAAGGSGMVIVEATCVSAAGRLHGTQLGIWDDKFIDGLSKLADVIHQHGALCLIQIQHSGLKVSKEVSIDPVAPSDFEDVYKGSARRLDIEEIKRIKDEFVMAAIRAKKAGFDGIELHGCHGYLISQFLSPTVNKRKDDYGVYRSKFAIEIIIDIREKLGDDFIIDVRIGGNDPDLKTCIQYAQNFENVGADLLHVSTGFLETKPSDMVYVENDHYNWIVQMGIEIKRNVNIPVIVVNGIRKPEQAKYIIDNDLADFVAVGKGILVDKEWVTKMQCNMSVTHCLSCKGCRRFIGIDKCVIDSHDK